MEKIRIRILIVITTFLFLLGLTGLYYKTTLREKNNPNTKEDSNIEEKANDESAINLYIEQNYVCNFPLEDEYIQNIKSNYNISDLKIERNYYYDFQENEFANNGLIVISIKANNIDDYNRIKINNDNGDVIEDQNHLTKYKINRVIFGFTESQSMNIKQYNDYLNNMGMKNCEEVEKNLIIEEIESNNE